MGIPSGKIFSSRDIPTKRKFANLSSREKVVSLELIFLGNFLALFFQLRIIGKR